MCLRLRARPDGTQVRGGVDLGAVPSLSCQGSSCQTQTTESGNFFSTPSFTTVTTSQSPFRQIYY